MPELPEVEVARRQLLHWAKGKKVTAAHAARSRVLLGQPPKRFAELGGRKLLDIERRGKWMLLVFSGGEGLISHLGMTGKWQRRSSQDAPATHVRASLALQGGQVLDYRDPRLFGRLQRGTVDELRASAGFAALGPDPLTDGVDERQLTERLQKTRRSLKEALMDQRLLAGLGNIHVSESLFRAGLHPERLGHSLTADEGSKLAQAIRDSIAYALQAEASEEPITYVEEGGDNPFQVYARAKEPCFSCGTEIQRIVQGGRSTFFCPRCQERGRRPRR